MARWPIPELTYTPSARSLARSRTKAPTYTNDEIQSWQTMLYSTIRRSRSSIRCNRMYQGNDRWQLPCRGEAFTADDRNDRYAQEISGDNATITDGWRYLSSWCALRFANKKI